MDTISWHMNGAQGGANLHPGANCAHEHGFSRCFLLFFCLLFSFLGGRVRMGAGGILSI